METKTIKEEGVSAVYKDGKLIAIIKLDEQSRKKIIYTVQEADIEFNTSLIDNEKQNLTKRHSA